MSSKTSPIKMAYGSMLIGALAVLGIAIVAQAQYNTFDSDSNSDSDGNPILTQAELGKLVRNSGRVNAHHQNQQRLNQQQVAATRNLYNKQQPLQYAPSHNNKRHYEQAESLNGYGPIGAASGTRSSNQNSDADDDDSNFSPNFDSANDNENEGGNVNGNGDGPALNLNQAASGYPSSADYNNDAGAGAGFGFGGLSGYSPAGDGSEFGPSDGFADGRRAKSASSPMGARGYGSDEDAGAPQYGPNSAVNGDNDDEGRSGYAPEGSNDNDNDDE